MYESTMNRDQLLRAARRHVLVHFQDQRPGADLLDATSERVEEQRRLRAGPGVVVAEIEVGDVGAIPRTGDMPGDGIQRLDFAAEAFRRTGVDQQHGLPAERRLHFVGVGDHAAIEPAGIDAAHRRGRVHYKVERPWNRADCAGSR